MNLFQLLAKQNIDTQVYLENLEKNGMDGWMEND